MAAPQPKCANTGAAKFLNRKYNTPFAPDKLSSNIALITIPATSTPCTNCAGTCSSTNNTATARHRRPGAILDFRDPSMTPALSALSETT